MQIHNDRSTVHALPVRLNGHNSSLAIIALEGANLEIYLQSPEDADELIKAAVAAKELLLGAQKLAPATRCPICGGHLQPDGSHVRPTSGAHIPAPSSGTPACTCTDPDCADPVHQSPAEVTP